MGANGANEDINFIGPHVDYSHNPAYFDVETNESGASGDDADGCLDSVEWNGGME